MIRISDNNEKTSLITVDSGHGFIDYFLLEPKENHALFNRYIYDQGMRIYIKNGVSGTITATIGSYS